MLDPSRVRVWRDGWWRSDAGQWRQVETAQSAGAQWSAPSRDRSVSQVPHLRDLASQALSLSGDQPIAVVDDGRQGFGDAGSVYLVTREWRRACLRQLVGGSGPDALLSLPSPPLVVVLRPHPLGSAGLKESIEYVRDAISIGRNNRRLLTWVRQQIHAAGLDPPRGSPSPDQIVAIIFAAQKREVSFVKDPVNGELMAQPEQLLCLDPQGECMPAGDCDDQLILSGSAVASVGIPVRLVVRTYPGMEFGHITLEYDSGARLGGPWKCIDPSTDSGACSSTPYLEQTIVDIVDPQDQSFVGLGDPAGAGALGQPPPAGAAVLPVAQAAGWIAQIEHVQTFVQNASTRLRANSQALAAVRADLGLPAVDATPASEATSGSPLAGYVQTGAWTAEAQAAESKLLQTGDFISQCLADGLSGARALYFNQGDILIEAKPGDPYSIRMAPGPNGGNVPTYFDPQGVAAGTLGLAPLIIGAIVAAVTLAVCYVVGKVMDQLATSHHDDALTKIANQQSALVASGAQTPEQAQAMVAALTDLNKAAPPEPGALQKFMQAFPIIAIAGAAAAGIAGGFGLSRAWSAAFGGSRSRASSPRRAMMRAPSGLHVYRVRLNRGGYTSSGRYFGVGRPLYEASSDDDDRVEYFRADSRADALEQARAYFGERDRRRRQWEGMRSA